MFDQTRVLSRRHLPGLFGLIAAMALVEPAHAAAPPDSVTMAVADLNLPKAEGDKAARVVDRYRQAEKQAYNAMLTQMSGALTPDQFEAFKQSLGKVSPAGKVAAPSTQADGAARVTVTLTGGHDTDPRDHGRPVVLVAAALHVPDEVFRKAFSGVHPAGPGQQPTDAEARQNKRVLLNALSPYGVDDDRLNEVSNYYRYSKSRGQMWRTKPAKIEAVVRDGKVTGFTIVDAGAGYSSPPTVNVPGCADADVVIKLKYGTDLDKNGSIESVTLSAK